MSSPAQRILMLVGMTKEARSHLTTSLKHLGWAVIEADLPVATAEKKLIQSLQKGKEVVVNRRNRNTAERLRWIQHAQDAFKKRSTALACRVEFSWIGVVMDGSSIPGLGFQMQSEDSNQPEQRPTTLDGSQSLQSYSTEGFDKVVSFRELQPDPVSFFGPSLTHHHRMMNDTSQDSQLTQLGTFEWNVGRHQRSLERGDVVLLFDLNGTLTSHTSKRRSTGTNSLRPGVEHLLKLKDRFRLGIFSSSTYPTVNKVLSMFGEKLGQHIFDSELIFCRYHTVPVDQRLAQAHRLRPWDTAKPLRQLFSDVRRVVLFDDDHWKAVRGEERNMVMVPSWNSDAADDRVLEHLVDHTLNFFGDLAEDSDLRVLTAEFSKTLWKTIPVEEAESDIVPFRTDVNRSARSGRERDQW